MKVFSLENPFPFASMNSFIHSLVVVMVVIVAYAISRYSSLQNYINKHNPAPKEM